MNRKLYVAAIALTLAAIYGLATPIHAAKSLSGGVSAQASVHRHIASFANGDSGVVGSFDNTCGAWAVSHFVGGGGGGIVEVYGSRDNTTAAGELLATLSVTSASPIVVRTAYPRIVVNINTAPAAGTDAQTYFVCSAVASGGGATSSNVEAVHYWIEGGTAANMLANTCFNETEGDFALATTVACTAVVTDVPRTTLGFPAGRTAVAKQLVCVGLGTAGATPPVFEVLWRAGNAPATQTASTAGLTFAAANYASGAQIVADINSVCPYASVGCLVSLRIRTAPGAGATGIAQSCDLFVEVS